MLFQVLDVVLILFALGAIMGWLWYVHRHKVAEARRHGQAEIAARYQAMIEDQSDLICRTGPDGNRTFVNEAYCRFHNRTREELIGNARGIFLTKAEAEEFRLENAKLAPDNPSRDFERLTVRHDGTEYWYHWKTTATFDSGGNLIELQDVGRDITERKLTELALKESESRLMTIIDSVPALINLKDADGRYLMSNRAHREFLGLKTEEMIGRTPTQVLPKLGQGIQELDREVIETGEPLGPVDRHIPDAEGRERDLLMTKVPLRDLAGNFSGIVTVSVDITDRKRAEDALQESEKRLRLFTDSMPALFSYVDKNRRYRFCNLHYEKFFRRKREDIIGITVEDLVGPVTYEQVKPVLDRAFSGETVFFEQWVDYREAGRTFVRGSLIPDISKAGEVEGVFIMAQDMTAKKYVEDSLATAKENAEEVSASKSRFLAAASHDLRQPMQALAMFVEVLAGRRHDKESRDIIEKIQASSESLESLLNSLLDISKLEADLVEPEVRRFTIGDLTSRLAEEIKPLAERKGLALVHVPSTLPVRSDPGLLDRILRNLLTNAVVHTESGRILFGCRRRGGELRIQVWDTGPGIPDGQKDRIFEEFFQCGNPEGGGKNGLGLGLSIVDRLVKLLDHRIEVSSEAGKGSVFTVDVPIDAPIAETGAPAAEAAASKVADASGALIVGIDDDPAVRDALSLLLKSWGFEVVIAANEQEANRRLSTEGRPPDLVIADYLLHQGDEGTDAIQSIRRRWGRDIPGLLLTGETDPKRLHEANASGFQVVKKPIQPDKLKAVVAEHIDSTNAETKITPPRKRRKQVQSAAADS